ncbi:MAG: DNA adenine methylase [Sedimentisphaerales bacterium]|jgi:hypothetical protein
MPLHPEIDLTIKLDNIAGNHEKDRNSLRVLLLDNLVKEKAGTGNKEKTSNYHYNVETLTGGNRIYLTRPVWLNKGFDFIIHVEGYKFLNGKDNPQHNDIANDLKEKKQKDSISYQRLLKLIDLVFLCNDPEDILRKELIPTFEVGFSIELLLKVIKWLFIEQDVTYWNWSGRHMLMSGINGI